MQIERANRVKGKDMKIQNLAVIFVIIILPISIVLSTYTGKLINVVKKQAEYDSLLMNSTYDSVRAYQMNTLNDVYDQVANAKVRDINASINSFFNSLAAGMSSSGYTKRELMEYIPAMLYTLYDGYYVYSAYDNIVKINGKTLNFEESGNFNNKQYGLKPFCYYSCTYEGTSSGNHYSLVINYTLDNYITVTGVYDKGTSKNIPIAASGYYIKTNNISINDSNKTVNIQKDTGTITIRPETLGEYLITTDTRARGSSTSYYLTNGTPKYYQYIVYNNLRYYLDKDNVGRNNADAKANVSDSWNGIPIFYLDKGRRVYINNDMFNTLKEFIGTYDNNRIYSGDGFKDVNNYYYYRKAVDFSNKVSDALNLIDLGYETDGSGNKIIKANKEAKETADVDNLVKDTVIKTNHYHKRYGTDLEVESHIKTTYDTSSVFNTSGSNDPELESSSFNQHRMDVIISSIENSLMSAISNYAGYSKFTTFDYAMPLIKEDEWNRICNNLTVVSFMQGLPLENYKFYTGYSVIANTKTKDFISKDAIYVQNNTASVRYNGSDTEYHNPKCVDFNNSASNNLIGYRMIDYMRQDVFVPGSGGNEGETYYYYLQPGQAAYECNVEQNSNIYTNDELISGKLSKENEEKNNEKPSNEKIKVPNVEVRRAYISALARERGSQYNRYDYLNKQVNNTR